MAGLVQERGGRELTTNQTWPEWVPWHTAESIRGATFVEECDSVFGPMRHAAWDKITDHLILFGEAPYNQHNRANAWNAAMRDLGYTEVME